MLSIRWWTNWTRLTSRWVVRTFLTDLIEQWLVDWTIDTEAIGLGTVTYVWGKTGLWTGLTTLWAIRARLTIGGWVLWPIGSWLAVWWILRARLATEAAETFLLNLALKLFW